MKFIHFSSRNSQNEKMFKKILLLATFLLYIQLSLAENDIKVDIPNILTQSTQTEPLTILEQMYRQAMATAFQHKSAEMLEKLSKGENTLPVAMDIVKISMLSQPTSNVLKKTASQVLSMMPTDYQQAAISAGLNSNLLATENSKTTE